MTIPRSNPPKVFVSQSVNVDFSPAERDFGAVVILSQSEIWPFGHATQSNVRNAHSIERGIADDYRPDVDYLMPTGSVLAMAHMFAAAFEKGTAHRILKWDARAQRYYDYRLVLPRGR